MLESENLQLAGQNNDGQQGAGLMSTGIFEYCLEQAVLQDFHYSIGAVITLESENLQLAGQDNDGQQGSGLICLPAFSSIA